MTRADCDSVSTHPPPTQFSVVAGGETTTLRVLVLALPPAALAAMKAAYDNEKAGEPGLGGYDRWFAQPNNAALAAIGIYTDRVPAFRELLHEADDDLPRFYERVRALSLLPKPARDR